MRRKICQMILLAVCLATMAQAGMGRTIKSVADPQAGSADDKKYTGTWSGSYSTSEGAGGNLSFVLSRDEKGQWRGAVRFTNQDGEQKAEMKSPQIANGKINTKIEPADGEVEVTIEGTFQGERLEGTYSVAPKGSSEVVERGTWKVSRSPQAVK